jgi:hypothetical protein
MGSCYRQGIGQCRLAKLQPAAVMQSASQPAPDKDVSGAARCETMPTRKSKEHHRRTPSPKKPVFTLFTHGVNDTCLWQQSRHGSWKRLPHIRSNIGLGCYSHNACTRTVYILVSTACSLQVSISPSSSISRSAALGHLIPHLLNPVPHQIPPL